MSLDFKTCVGVKKWLESQTKQPIHDVHKSTSLLYIVWGNPSVKSKIRLPGGVLYCLKEEHFKDILSKMNNKICSDMQEWYETHN